MRASSALKWLAHPTPREGQLEMIQGCIDTLVEGGAHLASAPTGVGKTAAALAAAIEYAKSCEERKTIMFLTPRQSQHKIVVDTVRKINERKNADKLSLVDMIGQSGMCVEPFADTGGALFSMLCSKHRKSRQCRPWLTNTPTFEQRILSDPLHVHELVQLSKIHRENGEKRQTCPWKAARNAARKADIVVCDYNHLFIEEVRNASLKAMELSLDDIIVIVDEAHNLPDRVRKGMERKLTLTMVRNASMELEEHLGNLEKSALVNDSAGAAVDLKSWSFMVCKEFRRIMTREFKRLTKVLGDEKEIKIQASSILKLIEEAFDATAAIASQSTLAGGAPMSTPDKALRLPTFKMMLETNETDVDDGADNEPSAHQLANLLSVMIKFGESTALCLAFDGEGRDGRIITNLLDAGLVSGPIFDKLHGSILMSGTLDPPHMFADLLSIPKTSRGESVHPSPFEKGRRPILVAEDVTTKYTERGEENTRKIQNHIIQLVENTPGNIAIFAPSYKLIEEYFEHLYTPGVRQLLESRTWSKEDIGDLLVTLEDSKSTGKRVIIGGVFNGKLSEGIDYKGGMLDAIVCIGIPNAPPSVLQKALGEYIKEKFGQRNFWRYANSQPAVNSILQAMGRPIRAMGDRALILLLDKRNLGRPYEECYPGTIHMNRASSSQVTGSFANRFFRKVKWEPSD